MAKEVRLAALTESMLEGTITGWLKQVGESVDAGEPLLEVETDKANVEVPSPHSGTLLRILVPEGEVAPVDGLLAYIGGPSEEVETGPRPVHAEVDVSTPEVARERLRSDEPGLSGPRRISPVARRLAKEHGIDDLAQVQGTGPRGLITADDVRQLITSDGDGAPSLRKTKYGNEEIVPLKGIRKTIADRMALSRRTAADVTTFTEVDVTALMNLRCETDITVTAYVVRAVVEGLKEFPAVNSSLIDDQIIIKHYINVGVAVALEDGLVVPVIHNAQNKSLVGIAQELAELTSKARSGSLSLDELSGGTFTVTNSGIFGSAFFTPIINYPESAILGVGKIERKPIVIGDGIFIRSMMYLATSYDHRVIDGATAVRFLQSVKAHLEDPASLT
jgi:2-oxoglutarate dehydrogenase complex dihydrolipoamide succinyltransferase (E2) component